MTRQDQITLRLANGRMVTIESKDDIFTIHMEEIDGVSEVVSIPLTPAAEKVGTTD